MNRRLGVAIVCVLLIAPRASAQTFAPGPYYAPPSWDMKLPVNTRFIVLSDWGNAALLDRETGLLWERDPGTSTMSWLNAYARCANLVLGSRTGWRLPASEELMSLVDPSAPFPSLTLPPGHPFLNIQPELYWSATVSPFSSSKALVAYFRFGFVTDEFKVTPTVYPWCVRGGSGRDVQ